MKRRSEVLELYDGVRAQRPLAELVSFRLLFHGRLLRLRRDAECSSAALQKLAALATAVDRLLEQHFDTKQFLRMVSRWNMLFAPNKNFRVDVPLASNGFLKGIEICDLLYRQYDCFGGGTEVYHLAELPGGFYWAFQHYGRRLGVEVAARMQSLEPARHENALPDMTNHFESSGLVDYGPHGGDLTDPRSVRWYIEHIGKRDVITADGGLDYARRQDLDAMLRLYYGEAQIARACLRPRGVFVMKVYAALDPRFYEFMYFLYRHFREVSLFKPMYSKAHSFELYVVCRAPTKRKASKRLQCALLSQLAAAMKVVAERVFGVYRLYDYLIHYPRPFSAADRARCRAVDQTRRYFMQKMLRPDEATLVRE